MFSSGRLDDFSSGLSYTKDTGISFIPFPIIDQKADTLKNGQVLLFHFFENGKGFLLDKVNDTLRFLFTENFGKSWRIKDSSFFKGTREIDLGVFNNKKFAFDSTVYRLFRKGNSTWLVKVTNFGDSVQIIDFDTFSNRITCAAFKDEKNGIFLASNRKIYQTMDGAMTFQNLPDLPTTSLLYIDYAKETQNREGFYMAGVAGKLEGSYFTKDDGINWASVGDVFDYSTLRFYNSEFGISGSGRQGEVIRYFTGLPFNSIDKKKPGSLDLAIFPNPTATHFRIQGADMFSTVFVSIFNLQGKLLYSGEHSFQTDWVVPVNTLSSGVYVVSLKTNHSAYPVFRRLVIE
ncbi:hypothetical protein MASR2M44_09410 [Bacteroidota bacterium]